MPTNPPKPDRRHQNPGRPKGTYKWGEKTTVYGHSLTSTAHAWVKENKEKIEQMARSK